MDIEPTELERRLARLEAFVEILSNDLGMLEAKVHDEPRVGVVGHQLRLAMASQSGWDATVEVFDDDV